MDNNHEKAIFKSIKGLERNQILPATGVMNSLKTMKDLRPGIASDNIKIPIYQGDDGADGLKAIYFEHVYDAIISGENVPALLPSGSDVDITIKVDRSEGMVMEVFFPSLGHTEEVKFDKNNVQREVTEEYLSEEINKAKNDLLNLKHAGEDISELESDLDTVEQELNNGDQRKQVLQHLKEVLRKIDKIEIDGEWARFEQELRREFNRLEKANSELGNPKTNQMVTALRQQVDIVIRNEDVKMGRSVLNDIISLFIQLTMIYQLINIVRECYEDFNTIDWQNSSRARQLINQGMQIINNNPTEEVLHPIVVEILNLLPNDKRGFGGLLSM